MTLSRLTLLISLPTAMVLAACSSTSPHNAQLEQARTDYRTAEADPRAQAQAATEMKQARDALTRAEGAWAEAADATRVNHLSYLTVQRVAIARETMALKTAESSANNAGAARSNIRLAARTHEADAAQRAAEIAQRNAEAAQRSASASMKATETAQADTVEAQRVTTLAMEQNRQLQARLSELNAKSTPRGLVITINDVLFDTDQAQLKESGLRVTSRLVAALKEFPQRTVLVEGFTDSTGSDSHNLMLSSRRADAVRMALVSQGVGMERVASRGYGEAHPVASNDSAEGRQLNRRVEIVLSNEMGVIMAR